jgi:hypothetical protein
VTGRVGRLSGGLGTAGPFPAVRWQRRAGGVCTPAVRAAKMFSQRALKKAASAQPAPWDARGPEKRSLAARGERSERPVAGTDEVTQADQAGIGTSRSPDATTGRPGIPLRIPDIQDPAVGYHAAAPAALSQLSKSARSSARNAELGPACVIATYSRMLAEPCETPNRPPSIVNRLRLARSADYRTAFWPDDSGHTPARS